jgi:hypothetical protein
VAQALARYDEFAEWYEQWIGDGPPLIAAHPDLLPAVTGDRVLDIACGEGRMPGVSAAVTDKPIGLEELTLPYGHGAGKALEAPPAIRIATVS